MDTNKTNNSNLSENAQQRGAFLTYFGLRNKRSLSLLHQDFTESSPEENIPSLRTIKEWSRKFHWVERVHGMDAAAMERATELAIAQEAQRKQEILDFTHNVILIANKHLLNHEIVPSIADVKKAWEMSRVEMGKSTDNRASVRLTIDSRTMSSIQDKSEKALNDHAQDKKPQRPLYDE